MLLYSSDLEEMLHCLVLCIVDVVSSERIVLCCICQAIEVLGVGVIGMLESKWVCDDEVKT